MKPLHCLTLDEEHLCQLTLLSLDVCTVHFHYFPLVSDKILAEGVCFFVVLLELKLDALLDEKNFYAGLGDNQDLIWVLERARNDCFLWFAI